MIITKLEDNGESIGSFRVLDYEEIIPYSKLEQKLDEFHEKGLLKIREIKDLLLAK